VIVLAFAGRLNRGGEELAASVVLAESRLVAACQVMHYRKDIWGEEVEQFNPERFQGSRVGWEFLPFDGGPRICLGQQFAITEASYVTIRLLQRFDKMDNLETDPVVRHNLTLTNGSLLVNLKTAYYL